MRTISREDWEQRHADFKTIDDDGQRYVLRLEPETGATVLEPIEVENGNPDAEGGDDE